MTVPVTGGSRSVDEETLHEFHLGFFGFIFTCNFIPVYFSPLPSSPCPLSHAPPLPPSFSSSFTRSQPFSCSSSAPPFPAIPRRFGRRAPDVTPATHAPAVSRLEHVTCMRCTKVSCSRCARAVSFPHVRRCLRPTQNPHPTHLKRNPLPAGFRFSFRRGGARLGDPPRVAALPRGLEAEPCRSPVPGHGQPGHQRLCTFSPG